MTRDVIVPSSTINRYRYARYKAGQTPEEIALQDKVQVQTVKTSIRAMETYNALYSLDALEACESEVVIYNKERKKNAIAEALVAEKKVYADSGEFVGAVIATEPDHDIRLRAVSEITKMVAAVGARHAKGPSTNVQLNQSVTMNSGSLMTFEDRLREIKSKRESLPAPEVIDVQPNA